MRTPFRRAGVARELAVVAVAFLAVCACVSCYRAPRYGTTASNRPPAIGKRKLRRVYVPRAETLISTPVVEQIAWSGDGLVWTVLGSREVLIGHESAHRLGSTRSLLVSNGRHVFWLDGTYVTGTDGTRIEIPPHPLEFAATGRIRAWVTHGCNLEVLDLERPSSTKTLAIVAPSDGLCRVGLAANSRSVFATLPSGIAEVDSDFGMNVVVPTEDHTFVRLMVAGERAIAYVYTHTPNILIYDRDTRASREVICPGFPNQLAIDHDFVYWSDHKGGEIGKISISTGRTSILAKGERGPRRLAVGTKYVFWTDLLGRVRALRH